MLQTTIKPLILAFTIATGLGVVVHDTRVDKASTIAMSAPAILASYGLAHAVELRGGEHTHSETVSESLKRMVAGQPKIHTRDDDKKYLTPKKTIANTGSGDQIFEVA